MLQSASAYGSVSATYEWQSHLTKMYSRIQHMKPAVDNHNTDAVLPHRAHHSALVVPGMRRLEIERENAWLSHRIATMKSELKQQPAKKKSSKKSRTRMPSKGVSRSRAVSTVSTVSTNSVRPRYLDPIAAHRYSEPPLPSHLARTHQPTSPVRQSASSSSLSSMPSSISTSINGHACQLYCVYHPQSLTTTTTTGKFTVYCYLSSDMRRHYEHQCVVTMTELIVSMQNVLGDYYNDNLDPISDSDRQSILTYLAPHLYFAVNANYSDRLSLMVDWKDDRAHLVNEQVDRIVTALITSDATGNSKNLTQNERWALRQSQLLANRKARLERQQQRERAKAEAEQAMKVKSKPHRLSALTVRVSHETQTSAKQSPASPSPVSVKQSPKRASPSPKAKPQSMVSVIAIPTKPGIFDSIFQPPSPSIWVKRDVTSPSPPRTPTPIKHRSLLSSTYAALAVHDSYDSNLEYDDEEQMKQQMLDSLYNDTDTDTDTDRDGEPDDEYIDDTEPQPQLADAVEFDEERNANDGIDESVHHSRCHQSDSYDDVFADDRKQEAKSADFENDEEDYDEYEDDYTEGEGESASAEQEPTSDEAPDISARVAPQPDEQVEPADETFEVEQVEEAEEVEAAPSAITQPAVTEFITEAEVEKPTDADDEYEPFEDENEVDADQPIDEPVDLLPASAETEPLSSVHQLESDDSEEDYHEDDEQPGEPEQVVDTDASLSDPNSMIAQAPTSTVTAAVDDSNEEPAEYEYDEDPIEDAADLPVPPPVASESVEPDSELDAAMDDEDYDLSPRPQPDTNAVAAPEPQQAEPIAELGMADSEPADKYETEQEFPVTEPEEPEEVVDNEESSDEDEPALEMQSPPFTITTTATGSEEKEVDSEVDAEFEETDFDVDDNLHGLFPMKQNERVAQSSLSPHFDDSVGPSVSLPTTAPTASLLTTAARPRPTSLLKKPSVPTTTILASPLHANNPRTPLTFSHKAADRAETKETEPEAALSTKLHSTIDDFGFDAEMEMETTVDDDDGRDSDA